LWEFTKTHNEIYIYEAYIKRSLRNGNLIK
jgi:hypothetical protein